MLKIWTGFLVSVALVAGGCASTPQATRERDGEAKEFLTHPDTGTVYVYRVEHDRLEDQTVLYIDGRIVGQTLPGAYFRIETAPGRHVLHGIGVDTGTLTLDTRPGRLYFVELTVTEDRSNYRLMPEAAGQQRVATCCALLENWAPGQRPLLK